MIKNVPLSGGGRQGIIQLSPIWVYRGVPKKGRNPLEIKRDRNEINMYALLDGYIYALQTGLIFGLTSHNKYFTIGKLF